ncbi:MAG: hypothetical protein ACLUHE_16240 [Christensenellales bacterium]
MERWRAACAKANHVFFEQQPGMTAEIAPGLSPPSSRAGSCGRPHGGEVRRVSPLSLDAMPAAHSGRIVARSASGTAAEGFLACRQAKESRDRESRRTRLRPVVA